jgi:hypothetical protein
LAEQCPRAIIQTGVSEAWAYGACTLMANAQTCAPCSSGQIAQQLEWCGEAASLKNTDHALVLLSGQRGHAVEGWHHRQGDRIILKILSPL